MEEQTFEAARAQIRAQVEAARARRDAVHALSGKVASTSATIRSSRGDVTVTADPTGRISKVRLSEDAMDLRPDDLSRLLTETIADAQRAASAAALQEAEQLLGADDGFVAQLRNDIDKRFPTAPPSPW
jgi:DNA-binding protein YbaB